MTIVLYSYLFNNKQTLYYYEAIFKSLGYKVKIEE